MRRKVNVLEMKCLVSVSRMERIRNEVRMRADTERELASRADRRVLRRYGHMERMDECHMARRVLMTDEVEGGYGVDLGYVGWIGEGGQRRQKDNDGGCVTDRKECRALIVTYLHDLV